MTRKRKKSKANALDSWPGLPGGGGPGGIGEPSSLSSFDSLPTETILVIFANLEFPSRQHAALVCQRWRDLLLEPPFCRHVAPGRSVSEALQACNPGDTLICPPGMYQETLLVDKAVRLVAEDHWREKRTTLTADPRHHRRGGRNTGDLRSTAVKNQSETAPAGQSGPGSAPGQSSTQPFGAQQQEQQVRQRIGGDGVGAQRRVPSLTVLSLRPPVVVMDSRCCFVGFEFHTSVVHNEVSICCFGPHSPLVRFENCTFSGLTGLRVPYSKGSQTRLELYDCTLIGTTQSLAAVQMDAGRLLMVRCTVQNNSVGVEVGPAALARLTDCELRWCGTALVVDGCLAMAHCRLWGNGKVGNQNTDARLRAAKSYSEACLSGAVWPLPQLRQPGEQPQQQQPERWRELTLRSPRAASTTVAAVMGVTAAVGAASPASNRGRGRRGGAATGDHMQAGTSTAATSAAQGGAQLLHPQPQAAAHATATTGVAGGSSGSGVCGSCLSNPTRVAELAAAQWAEVSDAFAGRRQLVRVVDCEVAAPQLIMREGLHKEVRKKVRDLVRQIYGAPDIDHFPEWEVLVHSDLDSDADEEDASITSGSGMADDDDLDLDDEDEDPLDVVDDPDLDESGESQPGSDSDSESSSDHDSSLGHGGSSDSGPGSDGDAEFGSGSEDAGEDEDWGAGAQMSSGSGSHSSSSSSDSSDGDTDSDSS